MNLIEIIAALAYLLASLAGIVMALTINRPILPNILWPGLGLLSFLFCAGIFILIDGRPALIRSRSRH